MTDTEQVLKPLPYKIEYKTNSYPQSLLTPQQLSEKIDFPVDRILELAKSGFLPSNCFDKTVYKFRLQEVKDWLAENMMVMNRGKMVKDGFKIIDPCPPVDDRPPMSICNVLGLAQIPNNSYQPGVYFLCKDDEVIYVGQSVSIHGRIQSHKQHKDFDRAYLLPIPESELDEIESAFIHFLKPPLNGGNKYSCSKKSAPNLKMTEEDAKSVVLNHRNSERFNDAERMIGLHAI